MKNDSVDQMSFYKFYTGVFKHLYLYCTTWGKSVMILKLKQEFILQKL